MPEHLFASIRHYASSLLCSAVKTPNAMRLQHLSGALCATVAFAHPLDVRGNNGYTFGTPGQSATFDYVIVGGGTAGLTLATRLSASQGLRVAVIEAGGFYEADAGNASVVPAYDVLFAGTSPTDTNPLIDWGFVTTPQAVRTMITEYR